jgi:hypothetical protein
MSKYVHMLSVTNIWTGLAHTQGRTFKLVFKLEFEYSQFQKTWSSSEFTFPLYCDNYYSSLGFRTVHVCPVQISPLSLYEFEYWIYYTHSYSYSDSTSACPPPPWQGVPYGQKKLSIFFQRSFTREWKTWATVQHAGRCLRTPHICTPVTVAKARYIPLKSLLGPLVRRARGSTVACVTWSLYSYVGWPPYQSHRRTGGRCS